MKIAVMNHQLCTYCRKPFIACRSTAKYCCDKCRNYDRRRRRQEQHAENLKASYKDQKPTDMKQFEVLDEEVVSFFLDIEAATSALIHASKHANPQLRMLCKNVGSRIRDVLIDEGVIDDPR